MVCGEKETKQVAIVTGGSQADHRMSKTPHNSAVLRDFCVGINEQPNNGRILASRLQKGGKQPA